MKKFGGEVLLLDRDNINTDEIIPAKYLTEITKEALKPHLLEDLQLKGFDPQSKALADAKVVLTRNNFGCGSSREHAPWAFEINGINAIVAEGFARIFRQNMLNCGMLPIELPKKEITALSKLARQGKAKMSFDLKQQKLTLKAGGRSRAVAFELNDFATKLIKAGGWVAYADTVY
ncbi:MAG: 3-isopropylmalate dehydratase small subunit [Planctomycetes bacterium]|nr:3-isopropylmalate dehydratase small subunit [Planctomycetota bacterium]